MIGYNKILFYYLLLINILKFYKKIILKNMNLYNNINLINNNYLLFEFFFILINLMDLIFFHK